MPTPRWRDIFQATTQNITLDVRVAQPAVPPGEPPIYGEVIPTVATRGSVYKHASDCACLPCEKNRQWSKTERVIVRTNRKKNIVPAQEWLDGRAITPDEETTP